MPRVSLAALLAGAFLAAPAGAAPLSLAPDPDAAGQLMPIAAAPLPQAPVRTAAVQRSGLGGGFVEFLFGGGQQGATASEATPARYPAAAPAAAEADPSAAMDPQFLPQTVPYDGPEKPGTIIINTNERFLYLIEGHGEARRYGVGVGKPGFAWAGVHHISSKREWPDWVPPAEMLQRRPDLPHYMAGGPDNPLGARAMYLGSTLYRIHGSNEPWTIGHAVSSGCIRMRNEDVIDLYGRVKVGTKVVVI